MKYVFVLLIFLLFYGCGSEEKTSILLESDGLISHSRISLPKNGINEQIVKAFFGDEESNRVVVVDVDHMKLLVSDLYTNHLQTHTADKVTNKPKVYVVNRGSNAIDVVNINNYHLYKTIPLPHHPRSAEAMNKEYGLCAVSGMDKPMVSIIDTTTDRVLFTVGDDIVTYPVNGHGGKHACGHPFWLDKDHFVLLDRGRRRITTYRIYRDTNSSSWKVKKLNSIRASTSVHQIIPPKGNYQGDKNIFYATAEGSDQVYPSVVKLVLTKNGLHINDEFFLEPDGVSPSDVSIHHGDFHPFSPCIYVGMSNGTLFVVNYSQEKMQLETKILAGKGAGHTVMAKKKKLGIVINHKDRFVTIVDLKNNHKIKDILVSELGKDLVGSVSIQAHPKYYISTDGRFLYAFLTYEGIMYKLDLDTLEVASKLYIGGHLEQGSFVVPSSAFVKVTINNIVHY